MRLKPYLLAAAFAALHAGLAHADPYSFSVVEGAGGGSGFNTLSQSPFDPNAANTASASFTYTGPLSFNDTAPQNSGPSGDLNSAFGFSASNISGYTGSGSVSVGGATVADFSSLSSFLGSSGSASNFQYGSWYKIDLGELAAGTVIQATHDDGVSIFEGNTQIDPTVSGPTSAVTDTVAISTMGDVDLYYSRQNGTPSILDVAVPEPASMAILGIGMAGFLMIRRPKRA